MKKIYTIAMVTVVLILIVLAFSNIKSTPIKWIEYGDSDFTISLPVVPLVDKTTDGPIVVESDPNLLSLGVGYISELDNGTVFLVKKTTIQPNPKFQVSDASFQASLAKIFDFDLAIQDLLNDDPEYNTLISSGTTTVLGHKAFDYTIRNYKTGNTEIFTLGKLVQVGAVEYQLIMGYEPGDFQQDLADIFFKSFTLSQE